MSKIRIVVITGGSGFGKTSIIRELEQLGYITCEEFARMLISQQSREGGILPWVDMKRFQQEVTRLRIGFYRSVRAGQWAFADRGLPDQLAFTRWRGKKPSPEFGTILTDYPYYPVVFVTPPWEEIYLRDKVRTEHFAGAVRLHTLICDCYRERGYTLVEIPKGEAAERACFILQYLKVQRGEIL
ncbi:MAG: AAA family ATPase [Mangrovibacterium sp.]